MKIGEAQKEYYAQLNRLRDRRNELVRRREENKKNQNHEANEGVILELSDVEEKYAKAQKFMDTFSNYQTALLNAEASKRQSKAMEKSGQDMVKCLEIARRIARGDKVPPKDEQKLLEFDFKLYMSAKNMAIMQKSNKKHKSLWEDEEEEMTSEPSINEVVDDMECAMEMPEEWE